jgi:hypothetical protein
LRQVMRAMPANKMCASWGQAQPLAKSPNAVCNLPAPVRQPKG